jgi:hypothetical protein
VLGKLLRMIFGLRVSDEDEKYRILYDKMKLDIKSNRGTTLSQCGVKKRRLCGVIEIPGLFSMSCVAG